MPRISAVLAAMILSVLPVALAAQDQDETAPDADISEPAPFRLELNNAATLEGPACQLTYVATNGTDADLSQAAYQVGFFDAEGIVRSILVLEFGALPPGRTRIVLFNLPNQTCENLSRIVVNDVAQCTLADGGNSDVCLSALETASRTDIQFGL